MAKGLFKKIAKAGLIGAGTVLSFLNPALGAPLIVAGTAINTQSGTDSTDQVAMYSANLNAGMTAASAMQQAGGASLATSNFMNTITANLPIIGLGLLAIILLPKLLKK